jgi:type I restriction enzyme S subunit
MSSEMNRVEESLIPKLRFSEFRGSQPWKSDLLGNLAEMRSGGTPLSSVPEYYDGDIPWVSIADMTKAGKYITSTGRNLTRAGLENCSAQIFPVGTVMYAMYASIGECSITELPLCSSQAILGISPSDSLFNQYLYYYLILLKPKVKSLGQHGTQANLNKSIVQNLRFPLPTLPEQQKIADCLSSLDELIAAQSRKVELLKTHKKGLMQQLFPMEGETVPRLRFAGFEGEWEVVTFGDVFEFKSTNSLSRDQLTLESGSIRNIHYGDIHTKYQTLFRVESEVVPYIADIESVERVSTDSFLREGDLVFADASEDTVDIGKSIEIVSLNNEPVLAGMHTILARPTFNSFESGFAGYLMKSLWVRNQIEREAQGTKVLGISPKRLAKIRFSKPKVVAEQRQIVELLVTLDDQITEETQRLESLNIHKKGLMQGLFPSVKEIEI